MKIKLITIIFVSLVLIVSCSKDDNNPTTEPLSSSKQITAFKFLASDNSALSEDVTGTIDEIDKTITITLPFGTDITSLMPNIEISAGAMVNSLGIENFSNPINYTITAEDGSTEIYTVTINIELSDAKQITVFHFLEIDNTGFTEDVLATIDETSKTIHAIVPARVNSTILTPYIEISEGATISPEGVQDFINPIEYTVTAENGTTEVYTVTVQISQRDILLRLYNSNTRNTLGWDINSNDISTWNGVTLDAYGNVTALVLSRKNLNFIPGIIGQLNNLLELDISHNIITSLPAEIGQLTNLTNLDISSNSLTSITAEISQLTKLTRLIASSNSFLTSIPAEIGQLTRLTILDFTFDNLYSVPAELGQLINLTALYLSINSNLRSIPQAVCDLETIYGVNVSTDYGVTCIP